MSDVILPNVMETFPIGTAVGIYRDALFDSGNPTPVGDRIGEAVVAEDGSLNLGEIAQDGSTYVLAAKMGEAWIVQRYVTPKPNPNIGPPGKDGAPGPKGEEGKEGKEGPQGKAGEVSKAELEEHLPGVGAIEVVKEEKISPSIKTCLQIFTAENPTLKEITLTKPGHVIVLSTKFELLVVNSQLTGGNIALAEKDCKLNIRDTLTLICTGTKWIEMSRSINS